MGRSQTGQEEPQRDLCRPGRWHKDKQFRIQTPNTKQHVTGKEANLQICALSALAWLRDAKYPMGSLKECSAQYATASEGNKVPRNTRSEMETNTETALVISSPATAQAELSMAAPQEELEMARRLVLGRY